MSKRMALIFLALCVFLLPRTPFRAHPAPPAAPRFAAYFDQQILAYLNEFGIAGAVVAVVQDGTRVGVADPL
jgi:CubicO group peptidase (beta-lactamase class C family)